MGMKSGGLIAGLVGLGILNCAALELYVAPGGDDSNTGTREAPFQSLEKAQATVRARLPMAGNEGITVWLRGGTYYLGRTLEFGPADSGTAAAPVTYAGYAGEKAVISGAIRLSTDWKPYKDGIYVAPVGRGLKFDMLFADGEVQVMARYPNVDPNVKILDGYAPDALSKERSARWSNPATGFARGLHRAEWGGNSYRITGRKPNGDLQMEWMKDNNRGGGIHKKYRMVENIFEELDAPGEWFYDESAGNLYFQPLEGMDPAKVRFEGASLEELIRIVGTADEKVRHLTFKNLTFTGTHRTLFTREYEGIQRSDWRLVRAGALFIQDAAEVTVEGCTFDRVGGNALFFSAYNRNHLVTNNEFLENGATCVNVVGSTNALRHANTWENHVTEISQIDGKAGPKTEDYPKDIVISYNHMRNNGRFEKQTSGVNIAMAQCITVSHNTIHGSPRAGINQCDGTWGGHIYEFNDLFDCVNETHDHGPWNSWGRDRFYSIGGYNHSGKDGKIKRPYAFLEACRTTIIRNNRVHYDRPTSFGIDLDDGSSNFEIYNNLLLNTEIKLREGFSRRVYNNIIVNSQSEFHVWYDRCRDVFTNNIVVNATAYNSKYLKPSRAENMECIIDKNVFFNGGHEVVIGDGGWAEAGWDVHSAVADPMFVDPANNDYRVKDGSPALKLGFRNFPMDQFGKPGAPQPGPITFVFGSTEKAEAVPLMGATINIVHDMATQSVLGAPDLNGVYFESLPENSVAAEKGFEKHDLIRSMNGSAVTDMGSFRALYDSFAPGTLVKCVLIRNQHETSFTFKKP